MYVIGIRKNRVMRYMLWLRFLFNYILLSGGLDIYNYEAFLDRGTEHSISVRVGAMILYMVEKLLCIKKKWKQKIEWSHP